MAFTWRDILLAAYPVLNQNWITPLISNWWFVQSINNAIYNTLVYDWNLWSFQNTRDEFVDWVEWRKTLSFTTSYPIMSVMKIYIDRWNWYEDYEMHRVPSSYILSDDTYSFDTSDNVINIRVWNTMVKKILVIYYRWQSRINTLDDEIDLPDIIRPAIIYFTLAEVIPVYHSFEQWRDTNYYNMAKEYLKNLRMTDTITWDRVNADLI